MNIGSVRLESQMILAPLAGISNLPFRLLAKEKGCGLVCSEMISAQGLVRNMKKTQFLLKSAREEKPLSVQIFGSDPEIMARAAQVVEDSDADILDINFGCSVKKVIKTGAGAALMREPNSAEALLKAVRKAVRIPVTIKIRSGWDKSGTDALRIARIAQGCGIDAVVVHPRTATQGFQGAADWSIIRKLKSSLSIPVIGNGDIFSAEDALRMIKETECDGVMIGRGAIGNPWIFSQIRASMRNEKQVAVDPAERYEVMERYVRTSVLYLGEKQACRMMRSRLAWFVKGVEYGSRFKEKIKEVSSEIEAIEQIRFFRQSHEKKEIARTANY
ncbi:MAG: tRNA dihydrouridine synthase DusB [Thermodesulfobacteriota bacterium]